MTYPYKQAKYDYGPRKGTIALVLHMTEGNGDIGDVNYLAGNPARGVSANFVALHDGTIWQMLPIDHTSGSLNPSARSTNKAFYGRDYLLEALPGNLWKDPNPYVISIEIGGKAADGPTDIQTEAVINWAYDMMNRYPTLTGIFGHADQTDTKPCPGTSANMRSIFNTLGHGSLFVPQAPITATVPALVSYPQNTVIYDLDGKNTITKASHSVVDSYSPYVAAGKHAVYIVHLGVRMLGLVVPTSVKPVPAPNCDAEVAAAIVADRAKAHIVYVP